MEKPIDIQLTIYTYSEADLEKSNYRFSAYGTREWI